MNLETEKENKFWQKIDSENRIYQSNKALIFGGFLVLIFSYYYTNLCLKYSSFNEFKVAVRTTEKESSLIYSFGIILGFLMIALGIWIRKKAPKNSK
jgi:uncharacterized membrane protein YfcA